MTSTKFAHISDPHLDFLQYSLEQRRQDFYNSWKWCLEKCVEEQVDFIILAGDLFHNRQARHIAVDQALSSLEYVQQNGIQTYAIIGNHELRKFRDSLSAPELLARQNKLSLIESQPHHRIIHNNVVVWGLDWRGAKTKSKVKSFVQHILKNQKGIKRKFQVLVLHCGLEEEASEFDSSVFSYEDLNPLHGIVQYVALGHIHRPYTYRRTNGPFVVNPGSTETNSFTEFQEDWQDRGFYIVEVDKKDFVNTVKHYPPMRKFISLELDVSTCENNREVGEFLLSELPPTETELPIFRAVIVGHIGFDIDRPYLESLIPESYSLNGPQIKDKTTSLDYIPNVSAIDSMSTDQVEQKAIETILPNYTVDHVREIIDMANNKISIEKIILEL